MENNLLHAQIKRYKKIVFIGRFLILGSMCLFLLYLGTSFFLSSKPMAKHTSKKPLLLTGELQNINYFIGDKEKAIRVKSQKARHIKTEEILVKGNVTMQMHDGTCLYTQSAHLDTQKQNIQGHEKITGKGPLGTIEGSRFNINNRGQKITLLGRSKLVLNKGI